MRPSQAYFTGPRSWRARKRIRNEAGSASISRPSSSGVIVTQFSARSAK